MAPWLLGPLHRLLRRRELRKWICRAWLLRWVLEPRPVQLQPPRDEREHHRYPQHLHHKCDQHHDLNRVSYSGGRGGANLPPTPAELAALRQPRLPELRVQQQNRVAASTNRAQFVAANRGQPQTVAMSRPLPVERRQPIAVPAAQQRQLPVNHPLQPSQAIRPVPEARTAQQVPQPRPTVQAPAQQARQVQQERIQQAPQGPQERKPVQPVHPAPTERPTQQLAPQHQPVQQVKPAPQQRPTQQLAPQHQPVQQVRPMPQERPAPQPPPSSNGQRNPNNSSGGTAGTASPPGEA